MRPIIAVLFLFASHLRAQSIVRVTVAPPVGRQFVGRVVAEDSARLIGIWDGLAAAYGRTATGVDTIPRDMIIRIEVPRSRALGAVVGGLVGVAGGSALGAGIGRATERCVNGCSDPVARAIGMVVGATAGLVVGTITGVVWGGGWRTVWKP